MLSSHFFPIAGDVNIIYDCCEHVADMSVQLHLNCCFIFILN